jgi:hypothetical protein
MSLYGLIDPILGDQLAAPWAGYLPTPCSKKQHPGDPHPGRQRVQIPLVFLAWYPTKTQHGELDILIRRFTLHHRASPLVDAPDHCLLVTPWYHILPSITLGWFKALRWITWPTPCSKSYTGAWPWVEHDQQPGVPTAHTTIHAFIYLLRHSITLVNDE